MISCYHNNNVLASLQWLRVPKQIQYKITVLMHNVLQGTTPHYLSLLVRVSIYRVSVVSATPARHASTARLILRTSKLSRLAVEHSSLLLLRHGASLGTDESKSK